MQKSGGNITWYKEGKYGRPTLLLGLTTVLVGSSGTLHLGPSSNNSPAHHHHLSFNLLLQEADEGVAAIQATLAADAPVAGIPRSSRRIRTPSLVDKP